MMKWSQQKEKSGAQQGPRESIWISRDFLTKYFMKDFSDWHKLKTQIEQTNQSPAFREQEIWWISLGMNVGFEQDGKHQSFERPALIFRKFNQELFWAFPLTTKQKAGKFYFCFPLFNEPRTLILSQLRVLSAKRLRRRMSKVSDTVFGRLNNRFIDFLNETAPLLRVPRVPNGNL